MSLIIDALKKAQELRSKDLKGGVFLRNTYPKNKNRSMPSIRRWVIIGFSLFGIFILIFLAWKPIPPPPSQSTHKVIASKEKEEFGTVLEVKTLEISKDTLSRNFPEETKDQTNLLKLEKPLILTEPKVREKDGGPPHLSSSLLEEPQNKIGFKKEEVEKILSTSPPSSLREKVLENSIKVERERGKEPNLSSEVVNQFNLGVSYQNQKEYLKAIEAYKKVIELDPNYGEAYNNLAILYQEIGDDHRAFEIYKKLIQISPQYEKAYNNLGILFYLKGRDGEAMEAFEKAININPHNIESYINLGVLYKKQGQWNKAIESYQRALSIDPFHKETHYNIGLLYEQMEQIELAVGHYQKFVQLASNTHPELVSKVQRHLKALTKVNEGK